MRNKCKQHWQMAQWEAGRDFAKLQNIDVVGTQDSKCAGCMKYKNGTIITEKRKDTAKYSLENSSLATKERNL